jgi:hypothetical protein
VGRVGSVVLLVVIHRNEPLRTPLILDRQAPAQIELGEKATCDSNREGVNVKHALGLHKERLQ